MDDLISKQALKEDLLKRGFFPVIVKCALENAPAVVGNCDGCIWANRKRPQKCSCCRRNPHLKDCYESTERKTNND